MNNILVGARLGVYINGKPFAKVASFNHTETTPQRTLSGIDTLQPLETIPGPVGVSGSMTIFRSAHDGGVEGAGMLPTWEAMTRGKYFSILLIDLPTQTIIFESQKNTVVNQSWQISRGYVMGNINFVGITYGNETESPV